MSTQTASRTRTNTEKSAGMKSAMTSAMTLLADALGVERGDGGGSRCAVCGDSPFESAGDWKRASGTNVVDFERYYSVDSICLGCRTALGGRPGYTDFVPPRMRSLLVENGELSYLDQAGWWALLHKPRAGVVASWAESKKKHHCLFAGVSDRRRWRIGSDRERIEFDHSPELLRAVGRGSAIGAGKGAMLTGRYPPKLWREHGGQLAEMERELVKWRGSSALRLVVYASPRRERKDVEKGDTAMADISDADKQAVDLLATLAFASGARVGDGISFWNGNFYSRRIARFARLPLADFVARMMDEIQCQHSLVDAPALFARITDPAGVERSLRMRGSTLLCAFAQQAVKERRK